MLAHDAAIGFAELAEPRQILPLIEHEPGQPGDMVSAAAGFADEGDDIGKRLPRLRDKIPALEFLLGIPADLTGEKNDAALGGDAVAEALGRFPLARMKECMGLGHLHPP